jgi:hypothetical protein
MSKFACRCGYIISFNVVPCRYEGAVIPDSIEDGLYEAASHEISQFIDAVKENRRDDWLRLFYGDVFEIDNNSIIQYLRQKSWQLKHENRAFGTKL